ncbi:MAG: protein kinase [Thioploca sp.]|nr:protein kinase [Thioploca sp.]
MVEDKFNSELQQVESSITTSKTIVGAIPFMSPELIQTPKEANKSSDIWAIGAILYYLMTGKYPFGNGLNAVIGISTAKLPVKPSLFEKTQFKGLCNQLWEIIGMCLQKEPKSRPTANELVREFSKVCYSLSERQTGQIKSFIGHNNKNRGFISCQDGNEVFFHIDSFYSYKEPSIGMKVNFAQFDGEPKPRAFPLLPIK